MIKARGKRTVHFHRLPRLSLFLSTSPHLSGPVYSCRKEGAGRDEQDDESSNEDIASRCCLVRARCLRGQVRKRGHSRISRRDPPPLYPPSILIGTIERLSRDNGQDYAQESVSSVHVGVTRRHLSMRAIRANNTLRNREIVKIGMKRVFRVVPNVMRRRAKRHIRCAYSVNRGRYLPLVPHVHRATPISNTPLPFLLLRPLPAYCLPVNTIRSETPLLIANKCSLFFSLSLSLVFLFSYLFRGIFFFLPPKKSVSKEERIRNRYIYDTRLSTSISNSGHLVKIRKILSSLKR